MKKELKDKWIAALRSGKYEQGRDYLRSLDDKYCCLGVLCAVQGGQFEKRNFEDAYVIYGDEGKKCPYHGKPPEKFRGGLLYNDIMQLIDMNDVSRSDFDTIADWIEANIPVGE